jgi:hypothetical protein
LSEENTIKNPSVIEIQKFLNKKGLTDYEDKILKEDGGWGDRTASAFAKYHFGINTKISNTKDLWMKLKLQKYDVGSSYKSTNSLINAITEIINYKESPTTGVSDFFSDLFGGEMTSEKLGDYGKRLVKYTSTKLNDQDEFVDDRLFDKHIKTVDDGNKFREWVHSKPLLLKGINTELKEVGVSGDFSEKGPIDNIHFLLAWDYAGKNYLNDTVREYMTDDQWYGKIVDELSKELEENLQKKLQNYKQTYKSSYEYKMYKKALSNWNSVSSTFGWGQPKSFALDNSNFNQIADSIKLSSTCIDPSWLLIKLFIAEEKLKLLMGTYTTKNDLTSMIHGGSETKKVSVMGIIDANTDLDSFKDYEEAKNYLEDEWIKYLTSGGDEGYTANRFKPNDNPFNQRALWGPDDSRKKEEDRQKILADLDQKKRQALLKAFKLLENDNDGLELLVIRNNYKNLLDFVYKHNELISIQNVEEVKRINFGEKEVSTENTINEQSVVGAPNYGVASDKVPKWEVIRFTMKEACKNYGGVFLYSDPNDTNQRKNPYVCCAKSIGEEDTAKVKGSLWVRQSGGYIYPQGKNGTETIRVMDVCSQENVQTWGDWLSDKVSDCWEDWHCLADIASIVLSFFGPVGIIAAAVVDSVSALGYLAEEGWEEGKWDIILTGIGAIPGLGEISKFAKGGPKVTKALFEIGKSIEGLDNIEAAIRIKKITSTLSKAEKKVIDDILVAFDKLKGKEDLLYKSLPNPDEIAKLSSWEKDILSDMVKKLSPEEFFTKYSKAGDLKTLLKGTKIKSVVSLGNITQIGLFLGLYVGNEKIGEFIKHIYDTTGWDPFGLFTGKKSDQDEGQSDVEKSLLYIYDIIGKEESDRSEHEQDVLEKANGDLENFQNKEMEENLEKGYKILTKCYDYLNDIKNKYPENENIGDYTYEFKSWVMKELSGVGVGKDVMYVLYEIEKLSNDITKLTDEKEVEESLRLFYDKIGVEADNLPKLTQEEVQIQLITNDPNKKDTIGMENLTNLSELRDIKETIDNIIEEDSIVLNEEINRIKSLFTDERLYGNLVNEVCDDEEDAKSFLRGKGYIISKESKHDVCIGDDTPLGKVYKFLTTGSGKYNDLNKLRFIPKNYGNQCALKFRQKNPQDGKLVMFTLFYTEDGRKEWNCYYQFAADDRDVCGRTLQDIINRHTANPAVSAIASTTFAENFEIYVSGDRRLDLPNKEYRIGAKWVKIAGDWDVTLNAKGEVTDLTMKNGLLAGLYDKSGTDKVGAIDFKIPNPLDPSEEIPVNIDITGLSETGGTELWMAESGGGMCDTVFNIIKSEVGFDIYGDFKINNILDKVK